MCSQTPTFHSMDDSQAVRNTEKADTGVFEGVEPRIGN